MACSFIALNNRVNYCIIYTNELSKTEGRSNKLLVFYHEVGFVDKKEKE